MVSNLLQLRLDQVGTRIIYILTTQFCYLENDISEDSAQQPSSQNTDEDPQEINQSVDQLSSLNMIKSDLVITSDHPYGLAFDNTLAEHQRLQFERDMTRSVSSKYGIIYILKFSFIYSFYIKEKRPVVFSFELLKNAMLHLTKLSPIQFFM